MAYDASRETVVLFGGDDGRQHFIDTWEYPDPTDCDTNGALDACEILSGTSPDCNANGRLDLCDIADGDCNLDGVPDECNDCDANGIADDCDLLGGTATDCNTNGLLDACDLAAGSSSDCNTNQLSDACDSDCNTNNVADECEIASSSAADSDGDGLLDACELPPCETCFGDLNGDDLVDGDDLAQFIACLIVLASARALPLRRPERRRAHRPRRPGRTGFKAARCPEHGLPLKNEVISPSALMATPMVNHAT